MRPAPARQETGDGVNRGHFERLVEGQAAAGPRQPARHHRLAGTGRADHQRVVAAGGRDLERPPRHRLAVHVGEVTVEAGGLRRRARGGRVAA